MDTRRLFLAILLSLAVLLAWQFLVAPPPQVPQPETPSPVADAAPAPRADAPIAEKPVAAEEAGEEAAAGQETLPGEPEVEADRERRVVLATDRVRAEFTNRGGQLVSFRLLEHLDEQGEPLEMVRVREEGPYPFGLYRLTDTGPGPHPLNQALFVAEEISGSGASRGVVFRYVGPAGNATKEFFFEAAPEAGIADLLAAGIEVTGGDGWGVLLGPGVRNERPEERGLDRYATRSGVYSFGSGVERVDAAKAEGPEVVPGAGLSWVGLDDKYFLTALLLDPASRGLDRVRFDPVLLLPSGEGLPERFLPMPAEPSEQQEDLPRELWLMLEPDGGRFATVSYWGAKHIERLSALPGGNLDETIALGGPLRILAKPLLLGLHWTYNNVVGNYGWAIVLMTLALNLIFLPLTHKSYVSMRKMQEINPKMQALRARYRSKLRDKQGRPNAEAQRKMNEEMMALYKSEGVNPASGCLPMLVQMPFLFAFFYILRSAVELRHAPWLLWIQDLSAPEALPVHVLPLVMTVTQFLQQRMTPMAGDPMQRRLFQLMPFFFLVIFWGMPSGLVLYWLTNNVLNIARQSIYNHLKKRASPPEEKPAGGKQAKRSAAK